MGFVSNAARHIRSPAPSAKEPTKSKLKKLEMLVRNVIACPEVGIIFFDYVLFVRPPQYARLPCGSARATLSALLIVRTDRARR